MHVSKRLATTVVALIFAAGSTGYSVTTLVHPGTAHAQHLRTR